jgi:hypothetical protein
MPRNPLEISTPLPTLSMIMILGLLRPCHRLAEVIAKDQSQSRQEFAKHLICGCSGLRVIVAVGSISFDVPTPEALASCLASTWAFAASLLWRNCQTMRQMGIGEI